MPSAAGCGDFSRGPIGTWLPERYGPRTTCYNRFNRWRKAGVWDRLMDAITEACDGDVQMIDGQGAWANIPPKSNCKGSICFSPHLYKASNLVERFFNKIKHFRRIATRYDKLAANNMAMIKLASIRVWLRAYESTA